MPAFDDAHPVALAELQRILRAAAGELAALTDVRARLAARAGDAWRGGRRRDFDELVHGLDRDAARIAESLHLLLRSVTRALEDAACRA